MNLMLNLDLDPSLLGFKGIFKCLAFYNTRTLVLFLLCTSAACFLSSSVSPRCINSALRVRDCAAYLGNALIRRTLYKQLEKCKWVGEECVSVL